MTKTLWMSARPLPPEALYTACDVGELPFETTAELQPFDDVVGQDRAGEAVRFAIGMNHSGYNLFALGPAGTGKYTFVRRHVEKSVAEWPTPSDWCYVHNFTEPHRPRALGLPPGKARPFHDDMAHLIGELRLAIPAAFESDEYRNRKNVIQEQFKERQEEAFNELQARAKEQDIDLIRTPVGLALAPIKVGEGNRGKIPSLGIPRVNPMPGLLPLLLFQGRRSAATSKRCCHGIVEVQFEIVDIFQPHRQSDQSVADAELRPFLDAEPLVGRCRRMGRQALGIPQVVGDVDETEGIEKTKGAIFPVGEFHRHDAAAGRHLTHGQFVLRMALKAGVEDAAEVASRFQMSSDRDGVFAMPTEAQSQCFEPLQQQPCVERAQRRAGVA